MMTTALLSAAQTIIACPMCMSGADDTTAFAANSAIVVMLLLLIVVLGSFLTFIGYLAKRAKLSDEMVPVSVSKKQK